MLLTEWRHLGETNEGDLTIMQQDLTGVREGFGREGKGLTNSYLRAKEVAPGQLWPSAPRATAPTRPARS